MGEKLTIDLDNLREDERAKLMEIIESATKRKTEPWKPGYGEWYNYITSEGSTGKSRWDDYNVDRSRYTFGNCFKTVEDALFAAERLKVITELHRYAKEHNSPEFNRTNHVDKWSLYYDLQVDKITAVYNKHGFNTESIFASYDIAINAIKEIGEDRIKKYYFCVE